MGIVGGGVNVARGVKQDKVRGVKQDIVQRVKQDIARCPKVMGCHAKCA